MEKMEKLKKVSVVVERFLKIIRVLFIVCGMLVAFAAVMLAVTWFSGDKNFAGHLISLDANMLQIGSLRLALEQPEISDRYMLGFFAVTVCVAGAAIALSIYMVGQLQKVFHPMVQGQPFDTTVSKAIRHMAGGVLIGGSLLQLLKMLTEFLQYKMFSLDTLFLNSHISGCKVDLEFEMQYLIWAGLLLLLSYVFRYGEELQKQADETL